jgi:Ca-activated chloride channel family protein
MTFLWPGLLWSLVLLPLAIVVYAQRLRRRQDILAELSSFEPNAVQARRPAQLRRHLPSAFMFFGLGVLLFGLARPQMKVALPHTEGTVILALDVSNSMSADDVEPSRLEAAKSAARVLVEGQPAAVQLGVVTFGGSGQIIQPPTDDQAAVLAAIDRITAEGGTSLGEAIFTSLNAIAGRALSIDAAAADDSGQALRIDDYSSAVVMLFTDGENTEMPDPLEVANLAAEAGVRVYTVGVGTTEGATVEVDGFNIVSQLNEPALQDIASETNGAYYQVDDQQSVDAIYDQVDLQLTSNGQDMEITSILAGISALLLLAGGVLALSWFGRVP